MGDRYPEHAKLREISSESQQIGEFLDWLQSAAGLTLGCYVGDDDVLVPFQTRTEDLLAQYFGVNLERLEAEKLNMLEEQRRLNAATISHPEEEK